MGKIFCEFSKAICLNGIDFKIIQQIVNSLPGETRFKMSVFDISKNVTRLEMENDYFADGVQIQANYKTVSQTINGIMYFPHVFDGITIIDPLQPVATQGNTSSGQALTPSRYVNPFIAPSIAGINGNSGLYPTSVPINVKIDLTTIPMPKRNQVCTCGADSVGGLHAGYCDKA
jgi:hypothetical protein